MKVILALLLLFSLSPSLLAQDAASLQREEMKKLSWMVGQWQGQSWMERGPGPRNTSTVTETVQNKLDGLVLLVEGLGKSTVAGKEITVHNALGIISYDEQAKVFRMHTITAEGRSTNTEMKIGEKMIEWGFQTPRGTVRYTSRLNEKDEWFEIGEFSQDGQTWRQFFEMTLQRVQ